MYKWKNLLCTNVGILICVFEYSSLKLNNDKECVVVVIVADDDNFNLQV